MADSTLDPGWVGISLMLIVFVLLPLWATIKCGSVGWRIFRGHRVSAADWLGLTVWIAGVAFLVAAFVLLWPWDAP